MSPVQSPQPTVDDQPPSSPEHRARRRLPVELLVVAVALIPRIGFVLASSGGYRGSFEYDPAVYYASAASFLHGRLPYQDFLLLHPPGSMLALTPFAALGEVIGDHRGFAVAQLAFAVLGAVNAGLVARIARNLGFGVPAALLGGAFYALWPGAANAEYASRLEPLGNFCLLAGLLAYTAAERSPRRRWPVLCGLGFGLAVGVKIWWIAPLAVLLAWHLTAERRRRLLPVAAGAAAGMLLVLGPFFLAAPHAMFRMVVQDQIERPQPSGSFRERLTSLSGIGYMERNLPLGVQLAVIISTALVIAALCVAAWRARGGPLFVLLALVTLIVLVRSPSYFPYYNDYMAPGLALTVAAATRQRARQAVAEQPRSRSRSSWAITAAVAAVVVAAVSFADIQLPRPVVKPYPAHELARGVRGAQCVMADSPMPLILLNVLSRDLRHGCRLWVDVTGWTYDRYAPPGNRQISRKYNARWQRYLTAYLLSGDRVTLFRAMFTGIGPRLHRIYVRLPITARSGTFSVRRTHP